MNDHVTLADLVAGVEDLRLGVDGRLVAPLLVLDLAGADWRVADRLTARVSQLNAIVIGVSAEPLPDASARLLKALTVTLAPSAPGRSWAPGSADDLEAIRSTVAGHPHAAWTLITTLRLTSQLPVHEGLMVESLAYSMLQGAEEYREWRRRTPRRAVPPLHHDPVLVDRSDDVLEIALNVPQRHNAFGRAVRDGLIEALELAELDPSISLVRLTGTGPSFCSGGDLDEFGMPDPAVAHLIRVQQSAALAVHRVRARAVVQVHGACVGAGIEVPSFADRIEAKEGSWFLLPELSMGLIPGAGGTVGVTRRIGRWRTAFMALTGRRVGLETALAWNLVDAQA